MGNQNFKKNTTKFIITNILSLIILLLTNILLNTSLIPESLTLISLVIIDTLIVMISLIINILLYKSIFNTIDANFDEKNSSILDDEQIYSIIENLESAKSGICPDKLDNLSENEKVINAKISEIATFISEQNNAISGKLNAIISGDFNKSSTEIDNVIISESLDVLLSRVSLINDFISKKAIDATNQTSTPCDIAIDDFNGSWKDIYLNVEKIQSSYKEAMSDVVQILVDLNNGILDTSILESKDTTGFKRECLTLITVTESYIVDIVRVLNEIVDGNLSAKPKIEYKGKLKLIEDGLNKVTNSFSSIIAEIITTTSNVTEQSALVSSSAKLLEEDTVEQKKELISLVNTISHIDEITKETKINMQNSKQLAETTSTKALTCNSKMDEMLTSMNDIKESSTDISNIIKVIDEIAFQTNLLALNAAVESARAGVHGKGFAVVAEEVRNLAQRSQTAAKETTSLIEATTLKVNEGAKIANNTANELKAMVKDVNTIASVIDIVNKTTIEQSEMISDFKEKVHSIDDRNKRTESTASTSLNATSALFESSDIIKRKISFFKFSDNYTEPQKTEKLIVPKTKPKSTLNTQKNTIKSSEIQKAKKIELKAKSATTQKPKDPEPKITNKPAKPLSQQKKTINTIKTLTKSSPQITKTEKNKLDEKTPATKTRLNTQKDNILVKRQEVIKPNSDFGLQNATIRDCSDKKIPTDDEIEKIISNKSFGKYK